MEIAHFDQLERGGGEPRSDADIGQRRIQRPRLQTPQHFRRARQSDRADVMNLYIGAVAERGCGVGQ